MCVLDMKLMADVADQARREIHRLQNLAGLNSSRGLGADVY
jgi:hypothetical protein